MPSGSMWLTIAVLAFFLLLAALCVATLGILTARARATSRRTHVAHAETLGALEQSQERSGTLARWQGDLLIALDTLDVWWLRLDLTGTILAANNPEAFEVRASVEVVGLPVASVLPGAVQEIFRTQFERCQLEQRLLTFEYIDESGRHVGARVAPVVGGATLAIRDHTAERQREERLHESKERFALAAQGSNDGIWDWNLIEETVYWSWTFRQLVGDPELTPTRAAWLERVHPEDRAGLDSALDAHLVGTDGAVHFSHEHRVDQAGEWLWVLARAQAVRDAEGTAIRLAGSLTDLTNRRVVQVAAEKASLLQHATSAVDIGIGVARPTGTLDNASGTLTAIAEPWGTSTWWEIVGDRRPPAVDVCAVCKLEQRIGTVRVPLSTPMGDRRVHEVSWTGHAHEVFQEAGAHVVMVRDVTASALSERRLVELNLELEAARDTALEANRLKSAFLANMSHELRTPLNHVIGYAEMLGEEFRDEGRTELLADIGRIVTASRGLAGIVGRLLDLSRIEADQIDLNATSTAVRPLLHDLITQARAPDTLTLELSDDLPDTIHVDGPKLLKLLKELLDNALKFTIDGTVRVVAHADGRGLKVEVIDTGIGMSRDVQQRLFHGYYQADTSSTRRYDGTGMGLLLAQRLGALLGATLRVSSEEGRGTTITVSVPSTKTH